ncbi:hypothetical protein PR202_gb21379 [Eleusine coracana subsp. coracana]|uniref:Uncharacterized protein n=1 Tax=Eleusine coracana subsp. coracana TaxID=191504 RepID=A0AAV5FDY9_ELECO|nr:hypothetical protein QOZ80_7BG0605310 [Eleusine coracana subsp. coracana]GJN32842.1 hypothetical protein PR202_gb21379 [Eleusine coracana subsp. coracana]
MEATGSSYSPPAWRPWKNQQLQLITLVLKDDEGRRLTRTMRSSDRLQDLMSFYYAMVPTVPRGKGIFLSQDARVDGEETPADYWMKDGDEVAFFMRFNLSTFVTLRVRDFLEQWGVFTRTMRRTDRLQGLMDYYYSMVPAAGHGRFLFLGVAISGDETPLDLGLQDDFMITFVPRPPHIPRE